MIDQVLIKAFSAAPDSNPGAELEQAIQGHSRALWTSEKVAYLFCILIVQSISICGLISPRRAIVPGENRKQT